MTRTTGPDCAVMCNLINTHTHTHKEPHKSFRRYVGNGGDLIGKRKKCRKERVGSVAANPDNLESNKEAGGGGTRYSGLK